MRTFLKGIWIGGTMTVPGISGGTMAVVIGIYEQLITAITNLKKEPGKQMIFLIKFAVGALIGFLLFARGVTFLLEHPVSGGTLRFLFCGIVAGSVPLLVRQSQIEKIKPQHLIGIFAGAGMVYGIACLPTGLFDSGSGVVWFFMQLIGGIVVAVALILPGISVSHMLYILGLYQPVMERVYTFQFFSLIPLLAGVLSGCILTAWIMKYLLERRTSEIYMIIIGFVAASVISLLPQENIGNPVFGLLAFGAGAAGMYAFTRYQK